MRIWFQQQYVDPKVSITAGKKVFVYLKKHEIKFSLQINKTVT